MLSVFSDGAMERMQDAALPACIQFVSPLVDALSEAGVCAAAADVVHLLPQDGCVQGGGDVVDRAEEVLPATAPAGTITEGASDQEFKTQVRASKCHPVW